LSAGIRGRALLLPPYKWILRAGRPRSFEVRVAWGDVGMPVIFRSGSAAFFLCAFLLAPEWWGEHQAETASIRGIISDCSGGAIPGAVVSISRTSDQKTAQMKSDAAGHYLFQGLPAGNYTLEVRTSAMFVDSRRADLLLKPGADLVVDAALGVDPRRVKAGAIVSTLDYDLAALWRSVDAVLHLRIQKSANTRTRAVEGCECIYLEHQASVLEVFRRYRGAPPKNLVVLQGAETGLVDAPYAPGYEYFAFLRWNESEQAFQTHIMVPVLEGQVKSHSIREIESGMKLEAFLIKLRAMME
jgi:hypothetical protein